MREIEKKTLKKKIIEFDTQIWKKEMMQKPSLKWYRVGKEDIGYEICYKNDISSTYLAKARTNSLQLEDQIGRGIANYDKTCKLCAEEGEDLEHFIVRCPELEGKRYQDIMERELPMTSEERTTHIRFRNKNYRKIAIMIRGMWEHRKIRKDSLRPP